MEETKPLIGDLIGKTILVKTREGSGTKDASLKAGEYKGVLVAYDGDFIKLEYEITKFVGGKTELTTDVTLINTAYVIAIDEYRSKE